MQKLKLPYGSLVLVADGRKALFLFNKGDEKFPNLVTARVFNDNNPLTHEQGTDRPGRVYSSDNSGRRSSVESTDWHMLQEQHFAKETAASLEKYVRSNNVKKIVIVAPARALGDLRSAMHADVKERIVAEVEKDLTKHPVGEIEKYLLDVQQ